MKRVLFIFFIITLITSCSYKKKLTAKQIRLLPAYTSGMVLQSEPTTILYGEATPNSTLAVKIGTYLRLAHANSSGKWQVEFPEIVNNQPIDIQIEGNDTLITLRNVYPGKVYLVAGNAGLNPLTATSIKNMINVDINGLQIKILRTNPDILQNTTAHANAVLWTNLDIEYDIKTSRILQALLNTITEEDKTIGIIDMTLPGTLASTWALNNKAKSLSDSLVDYSNHLAFNSSLLDTVLYMSDSFRNGIKQGAIRLWYNHDEWWNTRVPLNLGERAYSTNQRITYLRNKFTISSRYISSDFKIELGNIKGNAEFYFNQQRIYPQTDVYPITLHIPDTLVRTWTNLLAIRFFSPDTSAGIFGDKFVCYNADSSYFQDISKGWKYNTQLEEPFPAFQLHTSDTGLLANTYVGKYSDLPMEKIIWYYSNPFSCDSVKHGAPIIKSFKHFTTFQEFIQE